MKYLFREDQPPWAVPAHHIIHACLEDYDDKDVEDHDYDADEGNDDTGVGDYEACLQRDSSSNCVLAKNLEKIIISNFDLYEKNDASIHDSY